MYHYIVDSSLLHTKLNIMEELKHLDNYLPKGKLVGFPIEVIKKMTEYQIEQSKVADISVFETNPELSSTIPGAKGFDWDKTPEGFEFWLLVIKDGDYDLFFERYPKETKLEFQIGDKVLVRDEDKDEWQEFTYIATLKGDYDAPYIVIDIDEEFSLGREFRDNLKGVCCWKYIKPFEEPEFVELTFKDISEGKGKGVDPTKIKIING
jgi:hypothetical protein